MTLIIEAACKQLNILQVEADSTKFDSLDEDVKRIVEKIGIIGLKILELEIPEHFKFVLYCLSQENPIQAAYSDFKTQIEDLNEDIKPYRIQTLDFEGRVDFVKQLIIHYYVYYNIETELHRLLNEGSYEKFIEVFNEIPNECIPEILKIKNNKGQTILHLAIEKDNLPLAIAIELLKKIPEEALSIQDIYGRTALYLPITKGNMPLAREILKKMSPEALSLKDQGEYTTLHYAIILGYDHLAREILKKMSPEALSIQDIYGRTVLHYAIIFGYDHLAREILKKMPSEALHLQDQKEYTTLHLAIERDNEPLAREILKKMSPEALSLQDKTGRTALNWAIEKGFEDLVEKIRTKEALSI
ncbi:MAG: Phosphocholine transferase AnkX [Candidatus Anoxychlamydiales bacterium]|nr:Phosphocholine transferase AnkX [Candidatus Anoxychlamydiales bacterium]